MRQNKLINKEKRLHDRKNGIKNHFLPLKTGLFALFWLIMTFFSPVLADTAKKSAGPDGQGPYLAHQIFADKSAALPGQDIAIVIRQDIHPGWHTYWKNPGDSGNPTRFIWKNPEGVEITAPRFPVPQIIPASELTTFGYEGVVHYLFTLKVPENYDRPELEVSASIEALVCKQICIPEFEDVRLLLPVIPDSGKQGASHKSLFEDARETLPNRPGWKASFTGDDKSLSVKIDLPPQKAEEITQGRDLFFFPHQWGMISYKEAPVVLQRAESEIWLRFKRDTRKLDQVERFSGVLKLRSGEQIKAYELSARPDAQIAGDAPARPAKEASGDVAKKSVFPDAPPPDKAGPSLAMALILAVMGGVILNLMPCVFPVLSMKALSLSRLGDKEQAEARLHGLIYAAGILVMFALIAAVFLAARAAGAEIGWGFQFQSPAIVLALATLLFLIGLNLTGFFEIGGQMTGWGQSLTQKSGHKGSFMTGMLATLVATPCTAPFMGTALGAAITLPPAAGMAIFLALGVGLALPYLALSFVPALRGILPRPGPWMEIFKQFLSFPMFASAVWLIWVYTIQTGSFGVIIALGVMVGLAFAIWLWQAAPDKKGAGQRGIRIMALAAALLTILWAAAGTAELSDTDLGPSEMRKGALDSAANAQGEQKFKQSWPYSPERLEEFLDGPDPVFVNMTAAWCITCKVNEKVALSSSRVKQAFREHNIRYIKGDWTNYDKNITAYLEKYGRSGVPLYVYYERPDPKNGGRPEPKVLPQILTPALVLDALSPARTED